MTDSIVKMLHEAHGHLGKVRGHLVRHQNAIGAVGSQLLAGFESGAVGASVGAVDYMFGEATQSGIPEAMIGPVPIVATAAFIGQIVAIGVAMTEKHDPTKPALTRVSFHVGNLANAALAGESALTVMRMMAEAKIKPLYGRAA